MIVPPKRQLASAGIALLMISSVATGQDALGLLPRGSLLRRKALLFSRKRGPETDEQASLFEDHIETDRDEQRLWRPASVWIVTELTPTSGDATATQLRTGYAFGWELPNRWRLDSAIALSTDSDSGHRFRTWIPSTVLCIPLGERFQVHAEYFGQFSEGRESNFSRGFYSPKTHSDRARYNLRLGCCRANSGRGGV